MSNIQKRLLFFFFAFPALVSVILFFPFGHYAVINAIACIAMGLAAIEVSNIFKNRGIILSKTVVFILGSVPAILTYLHILQVVTGKYLQIFYSLAALFLLASEVFHSKEEHFQGVLSRLSAYFFIMLYPGLFGLHIVRITELPNAGIVFMIFVAATYLNDSFAWLTGVLWGKSTRNFLTVSPNKSLVGFIFGFVASILVVCSAALFLSTYFPLTLPAAALLGAVLGISTILGDLSESALKRSGGVKDSGNLIPGRGGLLDSIDSPLFSAPVFFYLLAYLSGWPGL